MKTSFRSISLIAFATLLIVSCSRKKDNFISRNFHAVTAEYNTLFNGYNALEDGKSALIDSYFDNYWDILPIERMEVSDDVQLPGQSKNENFTRAEEKAVKAVQKHGMNIQGKEKNPQIDEAYLLLGKARYFDQRFVPALEAFNYILYKYPASDKINQAKIWREKANIRLENDELAIKNLKRLLDQEEGNIKDQDLADATSMLAQAYINTKSLDSALTQMKIASNATKNNDEKGRYNFIEGQLYNALGYKDSANIAFQEVIDLNRKIPRIYLVNAYLQKAKNFDFENGDKLAHMELLTDMEEYRENRPYLDKIYHHIGEYHLTNGSDSLAIRYYNKSLRTSSQDKILKAKNHETLAEINFDNTEYSLAGAYYDSTMQNLVRDSKPYRIIKRKRDNLDDVIYYEGIAVRDDSILNLMSLTDEAKLAYFTKYTDELKQKAEEERERQEALEALENNGLNTVNNNIVGGPPGIPGGPNQSSFYFYNQTTVSYGKNQFNKIWGDRPLEDNWRRSNKNTTNFNDDDEEVDDLANASEDELFDPQFYIAKIPTGEKASDSIYQERNFAYYQLGIIYKEKFKEYNLAKDKLQELLKSNPEERLILPSKYNLFKIYELLGENNEAEIAKNDIISKYPDSRYAAILLNPESVTEDENSPEAIYNRLYREFETENYAAVINEADKQILAFDGESIVPKFEFLKASAKARLYGYESYKEAINFIALNYTNTPEGKRAEQMMQVSMPLLAKKEFVSNDSESSFKALYEFKNASTEDIKKFKKELDEAVAKVRYFDLTTSQDLYDKDTKFVVVHGLKSIEASQGLNDILNENNRANITKPVIALSSTNYKTIQIHKNLQEYLESQ